MICLSNNNLISIAYGRNNFDVLFSKLIDLFSFILNICIGFSNWLNPFLMQMGMLS